MMMVRLICSIKLKEKINEKLTGGLGLQLMGAIVKRGHLRCGLWPMPTGMWRVG